MPQITSGLRKILSGPSTYDRFQSLLGAANFRKAYVSQYVQPDQNCRILDIGCGTGEILEFLPESVDYHGYDQSQEYIQAARARYGSHVHWHCTSVSEMKIDDQGTFDIVMANGILHHLDDYEVCQLLEVASRALKPHGRFCSFDGCFVQGQNPIARFLISRDRGRNVRQPEVYKTQVKPYFEAVKLAIRHDMLKVPYTYAIMVATKAGQV